MHACLIDLYYFLLLSKTLMTMTSTSRTMSRETRSEEPAGYILLLSRIKVPEFRYVRMNLFWEKIQRGAAQPL
jgi:hypothetical protein